MQPTPIRLVGTSTRDPSSYPPETRKKMRLRLTFSLAKGQERSQKPGRPTGKAAPKQSLTQAKSTQSKEQPKSEIQNQKQLKMGWSMLEPYLDHAKKREGLKGQVGTRTHRLNTSMASQCQDGSLTERFRQQRRPGRLRARLQFRMRLQIRRLCSSCGS